MQLTINRSRPTFDFFKKNNIHDLTIVCEKELDMKISRIFTDSVKVLDMEFVYMRQDVFPQVFEQLYADLCMPAAPEVAKDYIDGPLPVYFRVNINNMTMRYNQRETETSISFELL